MSNMRQQLFDKFKSGEIPSGNDFRMLIEHSFNDNVEVYTEQGMQTRTIKIFVGKTTVLSNDGQWSISYDNVGYLNVLTVISTPLQNKDVYTIEDVYLASVIKEKDNQGCEGLAFNASVSSYAGNYSGLSLAKSGTEIQVVVIGY